MTTQQQWSQGRFAAAENATFTVTRSQDRKASRDSQMEAEWAVSLTRLRALYLSQHVAEKSTSVPPDPLTLPAQQTESNQRHSRANSATFVKRAHSRHPLAGPSATPEELASDNRAIHTMYSYPQQKPEQYPPVRLLLPQLRRRILVTGGAGFVGSHLVDRLMIMGHDVMVLDNFFTGQKLNIAHWIGHPNFELVRHDVIEPILIEVDQIYHLACPASPQHYQANQIKTIKTNFLGTSNMLGLAKRTKARFLLASTSEVYGDPDISPQKETYNGNVNQTGPRACYDEGKRVAETLTYGYHYQDNVDVRVARIFNTYGPRMDPFDGRVMSNFVIQALRNEPITVYGDGSQTRSFCFVHDLIDGLISLMNAQDDTSESPDEGESASTKDVHAPVNLGNTNEFTISELVDVIQEVVHEYINDGEHTMGSKLVDTIKYLPMPVDDPRQRCPDTQRARRLLQWSPSWNLKDGVREMVKYYKDQMESGLL